MKREEATFDLRVRLQKIRTLTPTVRALRFVSADGAALPAYTPGSHVLFRVEAAPGQTLDRAYSLVGDGIDDDGFEVAVHVDDNGLGGSRAMHCLVPGQELACCAPRNEFPIAESAGRHVLIAGGIGITPLLAMGRYLARTGAPFEMHYAARAPEAMAYRDEVQTLNATLVFDEGDAQRGLDLARLFAAGTTDTHYYVCGPKRMIDAAIALYAASGLPAHNLHYELFAGVAEQAGDRAFDVVLQSTGQRLHIPADRTILDVLIEAGADPMYDCRRGDCGICATPVLEGTPDHRDVTLGAREKASGKILCTCVSRSMTDTLVLDL